MTMSRLPKRNPTSHARFVPAWESLENRAVPAFTGWTPAMLDDAASIRVVEYDPANKTERTLSLAESLNAVDELQKLDARARSYGYDGYQDMLDQGGDLSRNEGPGSAEPTEIGSRSVFPPDTRTRITATTSYPWRTVGQLGITFPTATMKGSGSTIGPYHVLTAAHCIYDPDYGGWATNIKVAMGNDGDHFGSGLIESTNRPYGEATAVYFRTFSGWTSSGDHDWDIAVVTLDRRIGTTVGNMGWGYDPTDANFLAGTHNNAGYPGDLNVGTHHLYWSADPLTSHTTNQLRSNILDTYQGNSGGPLWRYDSAGGGTRTIFGVLSHHKSTYNSWTRITQTKYESFLSWMTQDDSVRPPTDRADLTSYEAWFNANVDSVSVSTVAPASSFTVTARVRNNGTSDAGSFNVSFYLSWNPTISSSDYLLGTRTISSLTKFSSATTSWTGSIGSSVLNSIYGTLYVGYVIDSASSIAEFDESNNARALDNSVDVEDAYEQNDSLATAYNFTNSTNLWISNVNGYARQWDADWYKVSVPAGSLRLRVDMYLPNGTSGTSVYLYNASNLQIASSTEIDSNNQYIQHDVPSAGDYYLRVDYGNVGKSYDLRYYNWDITPPTVTALSAVTSPRNTSIDTMDFTFSEAINQTTLATSDISLTRNGISVPISGIVGIGNVSGNTWRANNLGTLTNQSGNYVFTVSSLGVTDVAGNFGTNAMTRSWTADFAPPTLPSISAVSPNPRNTSVPFIDLTFSEAIDPSTLTLADLALTRNGNAVNLAGATLQNTAGNVWRIGNLNAATGTDGAYQLTASALNVKDLAGNLGANSVSVNWSADFTAPNIVGVFLDGSTWTSAFRTAAGNTSYGFAAPSGAGQFAALPWANLNTLYIQFSENVAIDSADLALRGINVPNYTLSNFIYDSVNFVLAATIAPNVDTDRILIDLDGDSPTAVADGVGNALAGTWAEGTGSFPTTGAAGVDFKYRFVVAVGDATRDSFVRNSDLNLVRNNLFVDLGSAGYSIFADLDGNGLTRNADLNAARNHLFADPPSGPGPNRPIRGGAAERVTARPLQRDQSQTPPRATRVDAETRPMTTARIGRPVAIHAIDGFFAGV